MKRFIILAIALSVGLSSCDVLDTEPLSDISQFDYFKTETDLQLFSNSFYNNLLDKSPYDKQSDLYIQHNLSAEMYGGNKRSVPNSGGGWSWGDLRKMNTLLGNMDKCEDEAAVIKYTALTRFFRAYFYFEKVKRFGDVPWYDVELGSADAALYNPRDSRELIMTKMIEDVDFAIEFLPDAVSTYRVNKWTALALKARFCLYEGTYRKYHQVNLEGNDYKYYLEQSAKAAEELMTKGPYKLFTTNKPESDYLTLFSQEDASKDEYILAIKFDYGLGIYHNATAHTVVATQGCPGVTKKMINTYLKKNGNAFTDQSGWQEVEFVDEVKDRDPRLAQSIRTPGYTRIGTTKVLPPELSMTVTGYQPIKFVQAPTASGGNVDRNDRSTCDLPVFRYAEVLLNYAEAKAELGTLTQDDINISVKLIRDRVGMPNLNMTVANATPDWYLSSAEYGFTNVTGTNKGVILEIRRERAIELTQEGFRFNDLVRWKAGTCIDQEIYGMYFKGPGEYDFTGDGKADVILYEEGTTKPEAPGVQVYKLGEEIVLTEGNKGYVFYHKKTDRTKFNEGRDYLYPIPINERSLNRNLTQNPGWDDGLDF
ncbi:RagB/SusD family nutrient uptake outer membrane protein [Bacteroidales bacterium OttesenSCG-928-A17]|nr:RagB/SusD family nutrient uptake outer membrane protein [Bacteroidales bacterium OttesenSCG-928-A17]